MVAQPTRPERLAAESAITYVDAKLLRRRQCVQAHGKVRIRGEGVFVCLCLCMRLCVFVFFCVSASVCLPVSVSVSLYLSLSLSLSVSLSLSLSLSLLLSLPRSLMSLQQRQATYSVTISGCVTSKISRIMLFAMDSTPIPTPEAAATTRKSNWGDQKAQKFTRAIAQPNKQNRETQKHTHAHSDTHTRTHTQQGL